MPASIDAMLAIAWRVVKKHHASWRSAVIAIVTPLCLLLFLGPSLGAMLGTTIPVNGVQVDYITWFVPGIAILSAFYTCTLSAGNTLMLDRITGYSETVRLAPARSSALVLGHVLGGTAVGGIQGVVFLAIGLAFSPSFTITPASLLPVPFVVAGMMMVACIGFALATRLSHDNFALVLSLVTLPLVYASTIFAPPDSFPGWMQVVIGANPVSAMVNLTRAGFTGIITGTDLLSGLVLIVGFAISLVIASRLFDARPARHPSRPARKRGDAWTNAPASSFSKLDGIARLIGAPRLQALLPLLEEGRVDDVVATFSKEEIARLLEDARRMLASTGK